MLMDLFGWGSSVHLRSPGYGVAVVLLLPPPISDYYQAAAADAGC